MIQCVCAWLEQAFSRATKVMKILSYVYNRQERYAFFFAVSCVSFKPCGAVGEMPLVSQPLQLMIPGNDGIGILRREQGPRDARCVDKTSTELPKLFLSSCFCHLACLPAPIDHWLASLAHVTAALYLIVIMPAFVSRPWRLCCGTYSDTLCGTALYWYMFVESDQMGSVTTPPSRGAKLPRPHVGHLLHRSGERDSDDPNGFLGYTGRRPS